MSRDIHYYRCKFSHRTPQNKLGLGVSKSAGEAPNKPVLLLSVIELIERGQIQHNRIYLSPELISTFLKLWGALHIQRNPDIGLPFFHLRTDGFWHFKAKPGYEFIESRTSKIKVRTVSGLQQAVEYAYLDSQLFALLSDLSARLELTSLLIEDWFPNQFLEIERSREFDAFENLQNQLKASGGKIYSREEVEQEDELTSIVRDGAFRRIVTNAYDYRCSFCGLKILNNLENIVDGAHIKPFSKFYDDRIGNGLSLCKNHHWAFDRFWFTINDDYTIEVAPTLYEDSPDTPALKAFQGLHIYLPNQESYYPRPDALDWHRQQFREKAS